LGKLRKNFRLEEQSTKIPLMCWISPLFSCKTTKYFQVCGSSNTAMRVKGAKVARPDTWPWKPPADRQIAHTPQWSPPPPRQCELISFIPQVLLLSTSLIDLRGCHFHLDLKPSRRISFFPGQRFGFRS